MHKDCRGKTGSAAFTGSRKWSIGCKADCTSRCGGPARRNLRGIDRGCQRVYLRVGMGGRKKGQGRKDAGIHAKGVPAIECPFDTLKSSGKVAVGIFDRRRLQPKTATFVVTPGGTARNT